MKARILCSFEHEGARILVDKVVDAAPEIVAALVATGNADDHPEAVAHALAQGAEVIAFGPAAVDAEKPAKPPRRKKD